MWRTAPPIPIPGVPLCMRRGAQLWADQGWRCLSAASLARPRPKRAPQVPVAPAEGADSGGAFLLVTFGVHVTLLRKVSEPRVHSTPFAQKKTRLAGFYKSYCAAGRIPGQGCQRRPTHPSRCYGSHGPKAEVTSEQKRTLTKYPPAHISCEVHPPKSDERVQ
jgi:hypothetical protein